MNPSLYEQAKRREREERNATASAAFKKRLADSIERMKAYITIVDDEPASPARPVCPTCGGTGMIRLDVPLGHKDFGKMFPCDDPKCSAASQIYERRVDALLKLSGVPEMYGRLTFSTWSQIPAQLRAGKDLAAAAAWVWSQRGWVSLDEASGVLDAEHASQPAAKIKKPWLVLQGDLGLGKTGLAAAATNAIASRGQSVVFYRLGEMFSEIQSKYGDNDSGTSADDVLQSIQRAPILVLDECNLPGVASSDKARLMEEILRFRHARALPTLMTMNASQQEFTQQWGRRTSDVVFEAALWIQLDGQRLRRADGAVKSW